MTVGRGGDAQARAAPRSRLFRPVMTVLACWILFGGNMPVDPLLFAVLAFSGTVLLVLVLANDGVQSWRSLPWIARAMLLFFCLVPLLQLVPLPPSVWQALPGRELAAATLGAAGRGGEWRPLTVSIEPTLRSLLVMVWLVALLLALLQLSRAELRRAFGLVFLLGLFSVAIGIVQVVSGTTTLQFYDDQQSLVLTGLFANKNHAGLFIAMTFLAGYAALYGEQGWNRERLALVVPGGLILFVALLATFSRAGLVFGLLAIVFLVLISADWRPKGKARILAVALLLVGIALFAALTSTDLASRSLARFGGVEGDLRWSIWQWSWPLVPTYFPVGSGVGTFTAVFPPHEQLAWVKPTMVNHVHNDYVEQLLEIGIAAPVGWLLIVAALVLPVRIAWAERTRPSGRLALIGAAMLLLVAIHSAIDYPLRRPAIPATCMVALAALLRPGGRGKSRLHRPTGYARHTD